MPQAKRKKKKNDKRKAQTPTPASTPHATGAQQRTDTSRHRDDPPVPPAPPPTPHCPIRAPTAVLQVHLGDHIDGGRNDAAGVSSRRRHARVGAERGPRHAAWLPPRRIDGGGRHPPGSSSPIPVNGHGAACFLDFPVTAVGPTPSSPVWRSRRPTLLRRRRHIRRGPGRPVRWPALRRPALGRRGGRPTRRGRRVVQVPRGKGVSVVAQPP